MFRKPFKLASWLLALALVLTACTAASPSASPTSPIKSQRVEPTAMPTETPVVTPTPTPALPEPAEATLLAVGDIMVHSPQLPGYYDEKTGRYDMKPWFKLVKPIFQTGDWVVGNLETPVAGKELKFSGYPRFNAPTQLAEALVDAGVQIVSTANNHTMDRGFPGVERTLRNVRKAGLVTVGTAMSLYDSKKLVIEERNGIKMGFLAYTYGTNGIPIPKDRPYAVNLIDPAAIAAGIRELKAAGADAVTVSLHYGVEYQRLPNDEQKRIVRGAIAAGADIVLGSHPHVVQPYDEIDVPAAESADGKARKGVVIYSLGNFISNQSGSWKDVGLIFGVRLKKTYKHDGTSDTRYDKITTEPTWVHIVSRNHKRYYTVFPLAKALKSRDDAELTATDYAKMQNLLQGIDKHLASLRTAKT